MRVPSASSITGVTGGTAGGTTGETAGSGLSRFGLYFLLCIPQYFEVCGLLRREHLLLVLVYASHIPVHLLQPLQWLHPDAIASSHKRSISNKETANPACFPLDFIFSARSVRHPLHVLHCISVNLSEIRIIDLTQCVKSKELVYPL